MFPENKWMMEIPNLTTNDIDGILGKWLVGRQRQLTDQQRELVTTTLQNCPIPLLLKLSFDEAVKWHSYDSVEQTVLKESVPQMIHALFDHLEKNHGRLLVKHSLSYLTTGKVMAPIFDN